MLYCYVMRFGHHAFCPWSPHGRWSVTGSRIALRVHECRANVPPLPPVPTVAQGCIPIDPEGSERSQTAGIGLDQKKHYILPHQKKTSLYLTIINLSKCSKNLCFVMQNHEKSMKPLSELT